MRSKRYKLPNQIDTKPAAKRQIDYAAALGIKLPEEATVSDASALIERALDDDEEASESLLEYAAMSDILCSSYVGNKYLHNLIFDNLEGEKKAAFFCFCVYKFYCGGAGHHGNELRDMDQVSGEEKYYPGCENLYKHPYKHIFEEFGKKYAQDFYFTVSMDEYYGEELICFGKSSKVLENGTKRTIYGGSIHTTAFKKAYAYLQSHCIDFK